ncbi:RNA pyrophosphohydrolase [Sphingomonas sp. Root710]|uniref:RNA pyrophosphohydrolase n=1 Tax=Sphingomonas sp. Root710 TaxID=1736594 RepID=UPI000700D245|nr:RNA pyrophosphohydrolase [Sphingomonas sp. Root710]KRB82477.1 RNA pyrophosphohydrolase [Sphingomonas sp. Root710]
MKPSLPYRPAAAVMLLNSEDKVFVAQRIDNALDAWQMPQGGLDPDEDPQAGALRELEEETGIGPHLVEILGRAPDVLLYDLPAELQGKIWGGKYRGQAQHWFVARFLGRDEDIDLETAEPEFRAWKWADARELVDLIVPFKKTLYAQVVAAFGDYLPK